MQKGKILGYVQIWEILQILGYVQTYIWCPQWYNNVRDIINFGVTKKKKNSSIHLLCSLSPPITFIFSPSKKLHLFA